MHVPMSCSSVSVCLGFARNEGKMVMEFIPKLICKRKTEILALQLICPFLQGDRGETGLRGDKVVLQCCPSKNR